MVQGVTTEAVMMFRRDRRRQIDAVIDYFGGSQDARVPRPRPTVGASGEYVAWTDRFARAGAGEVGQILRGVGTPRRLAKRVPNGCPPASRSSLVE